MNSSRLSTHSEKLPSVGVMVEQLKSERQKNAQLRTIHEALISSIGDGVITIDEYGIITEINRAALDLLGYQHQDIVGSRLIKALPSKDKYGNDLPATERPTAIALLTGKPTSHIVSYVRKDGSLFPALSTAAPYLIKDKPSGAVITFKDFSREILIEKAKDEFVSLASHQLRTPLTSMLMYCEILKDDSSGKLSQNQSSYLKKIHDSAERLQALVTDFLHISKLELGKLDIQMKATDLEKVLKDQIEEVATMLRAANIELVFQKKSPRLPKAQVDPKLLCQAIHNILTNAIRYTSKNRGRIEIKLSHSKNQFLISISDNGLGIPDKDKPQIFQRLFRADNAIESHEAGTGLGLYFVKRVIEAFNGKVWFDSQEGQGSTFWISLPDNPSEATS